MCAAQRLTRQKRFTTEYTEGTKKTIFGGLPSGVLLVVTIVDAIKAIRHGAHDPVPKGMLRDRYARGHENREGCTY